jgi:hypothetical protein
MRLKTTLTAVALLAVAAGLIGCTETPPDTDQATNELQALYERAVELQKRLADAGEATDGHRRDMTTLLGDIAEWNRRYDLQDVLIGGPRDDITVPEPPVFVAHANQPIVRTPGRGCKGWSCAESYSENGWLFLQVCYLVKSICYTDGQLDCEYDCIYFPKWMIQPA